MSAIAESSRAPRPLRGWSALVCLLLAAVLLSFASCPGGDKAGQDDGKDAQAALTEPHPLKREGPADPASIKGNQMHEAHLSAGNACGDCHDPEYPMEHTESLASCAECHDKTVVTPVWEQHCLTCHHFTYTDEEAAGDPIQVGALCHDCHYGEDADQTIYAFIRPDELHNITCSRCHHPHESEEIASSDFCEECHPDLVGIKHPTDSTTACQQCHNPHFGGNTGQVICTSCHVPDERVLVHLIPSHPADCLECHAPHFDETEILGKSCLKCHDGMYYAGGENQPRQHKDCENCHWVSDFQYKGDKICGECHIDQSWLIENDKLPTQHRNCLTCHHPHTWRAPFKENCVSCHDIDNVLEHKLEFHKFACEKCHDPHLTDQMPRSGNCGGCHGPQIPNFLAQAPTEHVHCESCHRHRDPAHPEFVFKGAAATCVTCHTKPHAKHEHDWDSLPAQHRQCNVCHPAHHFPDVQTSEKSCGTCHADYFKNAANKKHQECFNCHTHDHTVKFMGKNTTCIPCHSDAAVKAKNGPKADCFQCHPKHGFKRSAVDCKSCHDEVVKKISVKEKQDCKACHANHTWHPGREVCNGCHKEVDDAHKGRDYRFCSDCHDAHTLKVHAPAGKK